MKLFWDSGDFAKVVVHYKYEFPKIAVKYNTTSNNSQTILPLLSSEVKMDAWVLIPVY